jgi:hypothetical protein
VVLPGVGLPVVEAPPGAGTTEGFVVAGVLGDARVPSVKSVVSMLGPPEPDSPEPEQPTMEPAIAARSSMDAAIGMKAGALKAFPL